MLSKQNRKTNFTNRFIATMSVILVAIFLLLSLLVSILFYRQSQKDLFYIRQNNVHEIGSWIEYCIETCTEETTGILSLFDIQALLVEEHYWSRQMQRVSKQMSRIITSNSLIQSIMFYNENNLKFISQNHSNTYFLSDNDYDLLYNKLLNESSVYFYNIIDTGYNKNTILTIRIPYSLTSGMAINLDISKMLNDMFIEIGNYDLMTITPDGFIAYSSSKDTMQTGNTLEEQFVHAMLQSTGDTPSIIDHDYYNIEYLPKIDAYIVLRYSMDNQLINSDILIFGIIGGLVIILLSVIISIVIVKKHIRPIDELTTGILSHSGNPWPEKVDLQYIVETENSLHREREQISNRLNERLWRTMLLLPDTTFAAVENQLFKNVKINLLGEENLILLIELSADSSEESIDSIVKPKLLTGMLRAITDTYEQGCGIANIVSVSTNRYAIVFRNYAESSISKIDITAMTCDILNSIHDILQVKVIIVIGNIFHSIEDISKNYNMLVNKLKYRLFRGNEWISVESEEEKLITQFDTNDSALLYQAVKNCNYDQVMSEVDTYIAVLSKYEFDTAIKSLIYALIRIEKLWNTLQTSNDTFVDNEYNILRKLNAIYNEAELMEYMSDICMRVMNSITQTQSRRSMDLIDEVKKYIDSQITCFDLSLQMIADHFGLSQSYISKLFKDETDQTFPQYISAVRLSKAKDLLEKEDCMDIAQIATMVGYNSSSYFCTVFKKQYGVSPSKIRLLKKFDSSND